MPGNTFGKIFRLTTFGESHGHSIGGVIDGCPAGLPIDDSFITSELDRRKPHCPGSTSRTEPDDIGFLSGIKDGETLGTPIAFQVRNLRGIASDHDALVDLYRPSHADFTFDRKYGVRDHRGGGRASGRETVARVVGGAVAKLLLRSIQVEIHAAVVRIGSIAMQADPDTLMASLLSQQRSSALQCPDPEIEKKMLEQIEAAVSDGDTLGGEVFCVITGLPAGWGEPVFGKLQADMAAAMMSIGTAKAFEYGLGFQAAQWKGSQYNDQMAMKDGRVSYFTNHDGGIQGGISNGQDIYFRVGFKPVPSVHISQKTIDSHGTDQEIRIPGRHDACHVPRTVVIVEAMAALVLADHWLRNQSSRLDFLRK